MNSLNTPNAKNSFWRSLFNADTIAVIGTKSAIGSWGNDAMRAACLNLDNKQEV